ncbi:MAG TPA: hypothetical protein VK436_04820 [Methanocella sp.]|nr:hypothetical protein [Methanocella sp.]
MRIDRNVRILTTAGVVLVLLTALLSVAMARDSGGTCMKGSDCNGKTEMRSHIHDIYLVKNITGRNSTNIMFQIPTIAITGRDGKAATINFPTPLKGGYNTKRGVGYISANLSSADITIRPMKNANINVAGASMVMTMMDVNVILDSNDFFIYEYSKIGMLLPDGTAKIYRLDKPVKVMYNKDWKVLTIEAYQSIGDTLNYAFTNAATFPNDAPPMNLKDINRAEFSTGRIQSIGTAPILRPMATATPAPTPTPTEAPTPTPTPTEVPTPTAPTEAPTPTSTQTEVPTPIPTEGPGMVPDLPVSF